MDLVNDALPNDAYELQVEYNCKTYPFFVDQAGYWASSMDSYSSWTLPGISTHGVPLMTPPSKVIVDDYSVVITWDARGFQVDDGVFFVKFQPVPPNCMQGHPKATLTLDYKCCGVPMIDITYSIGDKYYLGTYFIIPKSPFFVMHPGSFGDRVSSVPGCNSILNDDTVRISDQVYYLGDLIKYIWNARIRCSNVQIDPLSVWTQSVASFEEHWRIFSLSCAPCAPDPLIAAILDDPDLGTVGNIPEENTYNDAVRRMSLPSAILDHIVLNEIWSALYRWTWRDLDEIIGNLLVIGAVNILDNILDINAGIFFWYTPSVNLLVTAYFALGQDPEHLFGTSDSIIVARCGQTYKALWSVAGGAVISPDCLSLLANTNDSDGLIHSIKGASTISYTSSYYDEWNDVYVTETYTQAMWVNQTISAAYTDAEFDTEIEARNWAAYRESILNSPWPNSNIYYQCPYQGVEISDAEYRRIRSTWIGGRLFNSRGAAEAFIISTATAADGLFLQIYGCQYDNGVSVGLELLDQTPDVFDTNKVPGYVISAEDRQNFWK